MKFYLIVAKGKKQGLPIPIEVDLFLMGSDKMCQLRAEHERIGEQHCALVNRGKKVFISDLDSGHPTLVNGEIMEPGVEWALHSGDLIEAGPLKFMVQYREKALSQRDLEEWALSCLDQAQDRKTAMDKLEHAEFHSTEFLNASSAASAILERLSAQKGVVKGRLRISRDEHVTLVRLNSIYLVEDAELALLSRELHDNLNRPNLKVLLDLKNIKRMSSTAVEMFANLRIWLRPFGSSLAMCRVRSEFVGMFATYPATHDLPIFDSKDKARASKW
ncbi:FHA domain-containing protein [Zavarzinella formosa]|uniref:FHA domain-containing protein n=1 Tax=Zavarzinella formosa TaxID=360055 RepID=UPI0002E4F16D|nr:FHA domain-containing protein [Zavarzinella formosa]